MCIIQDAKHKTNLATKCAVQTNQVTMGLVITEVN